MKLIASILSVYILVLTTLPCHDAPVSSVAGAIHICQTTTDHSGETPDVDLCSPFCDCNCCASITAQEKQYFDFSCHSFLPVQYPVLVPSHGTSDFSAIWQPPKIA